MNARFLDSELSTCFLMWVQDMGQKNSIPYSISYEAMKVLANAHHQNSLLEQGVMLKITQIFFENSYEFMRLLDIFTV